MRHVDVARIRRENLRRLITQTGSLQAFADRIGSAASYLSTIVSANPKRNAGARLMRRVERAFNLEAGTLDLPDAVAVTTAMAIQALPDSDRQQLIDFLCYKLETSQPLREDVAEYLVRLQKKPRAPNH